MLNNTAMLKRRRLLALPALPLIGVPAHAARAMKVAFVYVGPVADGGWTLVHDLGRKEMEQALAGRIRSTFVENVPEGGEAERVLRQLAKDGNRLIFATSAGYAKAIDKVAQEFPKVMFEHAGGIRKGPNLGSYEIRTWEGAYLLGVLAGRMTRTNVLGMVASYPVPETIRTINAFTLGAQSSNPRIRTRVAWANSWHDPARERQAAESLIAQGADVLGQTTHSLAPLQVAQQRGKFGFGWGADMSRLAPRAHLSASINYWGEYYTDTAKAVLNGAWRPRDFDGGLRQDMVRLAPLNRAVPPQVAALFEERIKQIKSYAVRPFAGPLRDQDGHVRVSIGSNLLQRELMGLNWLVQGVEGTIPR
jgi:simple sugar transport system substrate-binding protein